MSINKMSIKTITAIVLATSILLSLPAVAQQTTDPQLHGFRAELKAKFKEKRQRFAARVKTLYFAVGCKVLASEAGIMPLVKSESTLAFVGDQTIVDIRQDALRDEAAREGLARAAKPGECDYYRRHPEAAEALRKEVAAAGAKP